MVKIIAQEGFDAKLADIINRDPASALLQVPGIYEVLAEEFNNQILMELEGEDETEEEEGA